MLNRIKIRVLITLVVIAAGTLLTILHDSRERMNVMECRSATVREVMVTNMQPSSQLSARALVLLEYIHVDEKLTVVEQIDEIILGLDRVCGRPGFAD